MWKNDKSGVYCITNTINGKRYIGGSIKLTSRWSQHRCLLKQNTHKNSRLQADYNLHGKDAFVHEVLEYVEPAELKVREQHYLDTLRPEYNVNDAKGRPVGYKCDPESVEKTARAHRGKKASPETRAKLSAVHKGHRNTEEHNAKIRASHRTPESRAKFSEASRKRVITDETRVKISANNQKRKLAPGYEAYRAKMVEVNRGKTVSAETRAKISRASKRKRNQQSA